MAKFDTEPDLFHGLLKHRKKQAAQPDAGETERDYSEDDLMDLLDDDSESFDIPEEDIIPARQEERKQPEAEDKGNDTDEEMRITMLGVSGSGKTAFLSGVYQTMIGDTFDGLNLVPAGHGSSGYMQLGQIADIALVNRDFKFPEMGTDKTTLFPLELMAGREQICDFTFMDYRGGDAEEILKPRIDPLTHQPAPLSPEAAELKDYLVQSQAILIFADGYLLSRGMSLAAWQKDVQSFQINGVFSLLANERGDKPLTVLIVITKTDDELIPDPLKADNCRELVERAAMVFRPIREMAENNFDRGWNFGIVPVSAVGMGNYRTDLIVNDDRSERLVVTVKDRHAPQPYNIEKTMVYTIACILSQWKMDADRQQRALRAEYVKASRSNTLLSGVMAKITNREDPKEVVDRKLTEMEEKRRQVAVYMDHIQRIASRTGAIDVIQYRKDHLTESRGR